MGRIRKGNNIMKKETVDRRVRKTKRALRQCLTTLLKEKKIQDITVRELADMADINRGTFYLHYRDAFDLMEQIESELMEEIDEVLANHSVPELLETPHLLFSDLYPVVYENADIISILVGENGDLSFVNQMKQLVRDRCLHQWLDLEFKGDASALEAYTSFFVSGVIGIVQYWLQSGLKESPDHMAGLTEEFILKGIRALG